MLQNYNAFGIHKWIGFPHDVATLSHWLLSILTKWKDSRNQHCSMFKLKWPQMNCRIFICIGNPVFRIIFTIELIKNIDSIVLQFQQMQIHCSVSKFVHVSTIASLFRGKLLKKQKFAVLRLFWFWIMYFETCYYYKHIQVSSM